MCIVILFPGKTNGEDALEVIGYSPSRRIPLADIGQVISEAQLSFDRFGRVTLVDDGMYCVLNDSTWINLIGRNQAPLMNTVLGSDGEAYYGGRGSFGWIKPGDDGLMRTTALGAGIDGATGASFYQLLAHPEGVFFGAWDCVVFYRFNDKSNHRFDVGRIMALFSIGERVFVTSEEKGICELRLDGFGVNEVFPSRIIQTDFTNAAKLDDKRILLSDWNGDLWEFDGHEMKKWPGQSRYGISGRISCMTSLYGGGVAIAIIGKGIYIIDANGKLSMSDCIQVERMANREAGVLWVMTEDELVKVSYGSRYTTLGRQFGLGLEWPIIRQWQGKLYVVSSGGLYEISAGVGVRQGCLEPVPLDLAGIVIYVDTTKDHLILSCSDGIYAMDRDGGIEQIMEVDEPLRVFSFGDHRFWAVGQEVVVAMEWSMDGWEEIAPKVEGLDYAPAGIVCGNSLWMEMGTLGVARITLRNGVLERQVFHDRDSDIGSWWHLGTAGNLVVATESDVKRRYFNEALNEWVEAPEFDDLLERSGHWILRLKQAQDGTLWASHLNGLVKFTPSAEGYSIDSLSYQYLDERFPDIQIVDNSEAWISGRRKLIHIEDDRSGMPMSELEPVLVSMFDLAHNSELLPMDRAGMERTLEIPFENNNLSFRFFAGGYAWNRPPIYEFRLNEDDKWSSLETGSVLSFHGLHDGDYQLQVRFANGLGPEGFYESISFSVLPPWHRSKIAFITYLLLLLGLIYLCIRWSNKVVHHRNQVLECTVKERTSQLEAAIEQRNEEAKNAATLAERNRMAGEIHDSLQQGLSGAMLQLESTLKLENLEEQIRSRLGVVRNMVSYTRQEVQHLVWDMESPLLEGTELSEALKRLASYIENQIGTIEVSVEGKVLPMSQSTKHNLLRIAQEASTNAVKHAEANRISLRLHYKKDMVVLSIEDDGVGFDPEVLMADKTGHFGLRGLRSRARKLSAEFKLDSEPGHGTKIRISVPMRKEASDSQI